MYDLSRLGGVGRAGVVVLGGLLALSGLAVATAGGRPGWLAQGDSTVEGGFDKIVGSRIAAALNWSQAQDRPQPPVPGGSNSPDLGVLLGASALGMGIDPTLLEGEAGADLPRRWLNLAANGANLADIHNLSEYLWPSGLKFRLLVLGIHPALLARTDNYLSDRRDFDLSLVRAAWNARQWIGAKKELQSVAAVPLNYLFPNRTRISNLIRGDVAGWKRRLFDQLGLTVSAMYAADRDPWHVKLLIPDSDEPEREAAAEGRSANVRDTWEPPMREGFIGPIKDKGWNDPAAYSATGANARALVALVREARERQVEPVILLLPERQAIRAVIPAEAMQTLHATLDQAFPGESPQVIDLRDALSDDQFHDTLHPNRLGRIVATHRLAEALHNRPRPKP